MKLTIAALAVALSAAVAVPAFAQQFQMPTPEEQAKTFDTADKNKDGKLDLAEFKTTLPEMLLSRIQGDDQLKGFMGRRDTDKDGFLSKAEFTAPMAPRGQ